MPLQFANPVWIDDDAVDLDRHIRRVMLPAPGTREQLYRAVAARGQTIASERYSEGVSRKKHLDYFTSLETGSRPIPNTST